MWIKNALLISVLVSFICTLAISTSMSEILEYKNPEFQTTEEFKNFSESEREIWYQENTVSHKGLNYIAFVLTDWIQFKELMSSLWVLFLMCFFSCGLMHKFGSKNGS
jgi:hypothetical protein